VLSPLVRALGVTFLLSSFMKLFHDVMLFIPPFLLKKIIEFVGPEGADLATWWGVGLCASLLIVTCTQSILLSQYFLKMYIIGERKLVPVL